MVTDTILKINEKGISGTLADFLRDMLEKKLVNAMIVPVEMKNKTTTAMVSDPEMLRSANPTAPVMPVSISRMVSDITKTAAPAAGSKIGVVLRSCEARALIELVKLKQASLENIVLIGIDCYGTYTVRGYEDMCAEKTPSIEEVRKSDSSGFREACGICEYPAPLNTDIIVGLFGLEGDNSLLMQATTQQGEDILSAMGTAPAENSLVKKREEALAAIQKEKSTNKEKFFAEVQPGISGLENLHSIFASCINCHNCREVCPLCYCRECFFDSPTFEWKADNFLGWSEKRGGLAMPNDRMLFHLTRLNHMVASCVGCGLCQDACPNDIPVFRIFRMSGDRVQASFEYVPGKSLDDAMPVSEFRENELEGIGN